MKRIIIKIGDIFSVKLENKRKKYFQFIAKDSAQLNSDVIRAFKIDCQIDSDPNINDIINSEVDFYAHCIIRWGVKMDLWEKVGSELSFEKPDVLFRDSDDYGSRPGEQVKISYKWYVWRINEDYKFVGELAGENQKAEIGVVISPDSIVYRMQTGKYDFKYPEYK
ncbi:MAG: hypothetical protein CVU05_05095 [Bacteroidetes bacterium HGW-Bacteroidetes-21]|jgi:hypothetical protein|nr:MAG: hypothetical protein CVU05_05095 [Bacteroidetes bacterium HGW-Bacteroidetes-21]